MADGSGFRFAIQKLNGENYSVWSYKVELLLIKDNLWEVIKEDTPTPADAAWSKRDDQARATIGLLVEDNQLLHIRNANTAREAWAALKGYHQKATLTSKVLLLKRVCRTVLKEGGDMEEHITTISNHIEQLTALGQELPDNLVAALLLGSLPESYETLVTALESRPESDLTSQLVKNKLIDEYKRRQGAKDTRDNFRSRETAMKLVHKDKGFTQAKKDCFFCKKPGHFKSECIKYKSWKNKQEKTNKVSEQNPGKSSNQYCWLGKASDTILGGACLGKNTTKEKVDSWFVDSGATSHMAQTKDFFRNLDLSRRGHVRLADDEKLADVKGIGSGVIKCAPGGEKITELIMRDVLYVPSFGSNLLSVKKLAKEGYKLIFEDDDCHIMKNGELLATAKLSPELYEVKTAERVCAVSGTIKARHCSDDCQHVWHRRFGHRDPIAIKDLAVKGLATGIKIKDCGRRETCECCVKGKMARTPFPNESKNITQAALDLIHTDVCGPMQTVTPGQKRYVLTIIDDFSRYTKIHLMSHKNEAAAFVKEYIEMAKTQFGKKPKIIRSDRGREYVNENLQMYLKNQGIRVQYTTAYSPQQNGVAERKNRYLMEMTRCMLMDANLEKRYWGEAVHTANYLQNRLPTKATGRTPYELWYSKRPHVGNLHIFGCAAYVHIHKEQRRKLDDKADKFIFVGYSEESKGYRFLDKKTNRIKISRDAVFLEKKHDSKAPTHTVDDEIMFLKDKETPENNCEEESSAEAESSTEESDSVSDTDSVYSDCLEDEVQHVQCRRSDRKTKGVPPERYIATSKLVNAVDTEPRTVKEALSGPNKGDWKKAMQEEIDCLKSNVTWDIVPKPNDSNVVTCKWVFKIKRNAEGNIERYKARLVARGFSQKYGTDYDEVFAPVVRQTTFRTLLAIAGQKGMTVKHFDAKTAFLNGELKETIYMKQPEGYVIPGKEDYICKLKKSIYGLKQAAKVWNDQLDDLLKEYGFVESEADLCLYTKNDGGVMVYLIIYVDDFLIAARDVKKIDEVAGFLKTHFLLTDLGVLKHYLGIEIRKDADEFYCIKQTKYIEKILCRFGLQDAKDSSIPLDQGYVKTREDQPSMPESEKYQQLIGALLYLAVNTRPDIAASVTILSQYNKEPTALDWTEARRVVRYLKGTKDYELKLGQRNGPKGLIGFADADWAEEREYRKSNSGYLFKFFGASISWGCRKQSCVALSSTEAEYIALTEATQEAVWLRRLLKDFEGNTLETTVIFEDNQSCLKFIYNKKFSHRTKHIDTKAKYLKDLLKQEIMEYKYCPTDQMPADMLTKALGKIKLKRMAEDCGLTNQQ